MIGNSTEGEATCHRFSLGYSSRLSKLLLVKRFKCVSNKTLHIKERCSHKTYGVIRDTNQNITTFFQNKTRQRSPYPKWQLLGNVVLGLTCASPRSAHFLVQPPIAMWRDVCSLNPKWKGEK